MVYRQLKLGGGGGGGGSDTQIEECAAPGGRTARCFAGGGERGGIARPRRGWSGWSVSPRAGRCAGGRERGCGNGRMPKLRLVERTRWGMLVLTNRAVLSYVS